VDRDVVGNRSLGANTASNWTRNGARVFPFVLALATGQQGERWHDFGLRSVVYAEAFFVTFGVTHLGKVMFGRARPYAYLSEQERPDDSHYDVSRKHTFLSMPSGHASSAWTGAVLGMTDHLLRRPEASWIERAGVGFLGGALAGSTSALRTEAGQHFSSAVLAGTGVGVATGVTVSLLHRGEQPWPSSGAWLQMTAGALAGTALGVLLARGY
jgi:membrane-associated phospholipid phosphatase